MPLPSAVAFAVGDVDYVSKLNQMVADLNATYNTYLTTLSGALFQATSSTSNTIGTGSKTFTIAEASQRAFGIGSPVRVSDAAAPASNYMDGSITAYSHPSITINVTAITGSGTKTSWNIAISAVTGVVPIVSGGTGGTDAATARTNLGLGTAATQASGAFATSTQGTTADNALPKAGGTMSGAIAMGNNDATGLKTLQFNGEISNTPAAGAVTISWATGQNQMVTLNAATVAITVNNPPATGHYQLRLVQDATGGRAVTWAGASYSASRWGGSGSAPSLNTNANGETVVNFYWNGTTLTQTLFRIGMA